MSSTRAQQRDATGQWRAHGLNGHRGPGNDPAKNPAERKGPVFW